MDSNDGGGNRTVEQLEGALSEERAASAALRARVRELEQELGAKHEELRAMLDSATSTAMLLLSPEPDHAIVMANQVAAEYFESSVSQLLGQPFDQFCEQNRARIADFASIKARLDEHMRREEPLEGVQVRLLQPKKLASLFCCPVRSQARRCIGWIWGLADVTYIERAAAELRTIVEASPVPLIITRQRDSQVLFVNQALAALIGEEPEKLVGHAAPSYCADADDRAAMLERLSADGRITDYEARLRRSDGSEIWALWSLVHGDLDGEQVVICALHDIDARRRAEDQLRTTLRELKRANDRIQETHRQLLYAEKMAVLGTLVAGIAHEIKTPIGAINSMQDTLLRAVEKLKRSLEQICPTAYEQNKQLRGAVTAIADANQVIESGSSRVMEIVKRLRSFARVDACELQKFDVHAGLDDTLLLLHHELKNRIELVKKYGAIPQIRANAGQLNQVFLNVLVNAAQAIPKRGTITIQTVLIDEHLEVRIQDDGVGVPPEDMIRIFEPGFTTKGIGVGTGLGLAICKKIVSDHHGRIVLRSEAGKGTCVTIAIPADSEEVDSEDDDSCRAEAETQEDNDG